MSDNVNIVNSTIFMYVFIDDILKSIGHKSDSRCQCTDSEILTTSLIASSYFGSNYSHAIGFVKHSGLMPCMIDESRFNRRLHRLADLVADLFFQLGHVIKSMDENMTYRIDSFPVKSCHNIRIKRSKLFQGKEFRGYNASKREYFYGVKVFVITDSQNRPVEYTFTPGSIAEIDGLRQMPMQLPEKSTLYGDSGFTDYNHEEEMEQGENIDLKIARKSNSKKPHKPWWNYIIDCERKPIETTFSQICACLPRKIHAVTQKGFLLKLVLALFAHLIHKML